MTKLSNSSLVSYTKISPNKSSGRKHSTHNPNGVIDKITIHHMCGNLSIETCGAVFAPSSRQASSNYAIGSDGRVGMYVEEKDRSWASSSAANDYRAVTIEVANSSTGGQWPVSDKALEATINLCVDICKRNGFKLSYDGTKSGSLTSHNMFASTTCPGTYLQSKFDYIVAQVNNRLNTSPTDSTTITNTFEGDLRNMTTVEKETIVKDLYAQALGRIPSTSELNHYVTAINNGKTFKDLYYSFHDSTEGRNLFVKEKYRFILGRDADASGLKSWTTALASGKKYFEIIQGFLNSTEYKNKNK